MSLDIEQINILRLLNDSIVRLDNYLTCREILVKAKQLGLTQNYIYEWLVKLNSFYEYDDEVYNLTLEIMDVVAGYCSLDQSVWENEL